MNKKVLAFVVCNNKFLILRNNHQNLKHGGENGLPDGRVDKRDLAKLSSYWANTSCDPNNPWREFVDLDRDGDVDFKDLNDFFS